MEENLLEIVRTLVHVHKNNIKLRIKKSCIIQDLIYLDKMCANCYDIDVCKQGGIIHIMRVLK